MNEEFEIFYTTSVVNIDVRDTKKGLRILLVPIKPCAACKTFIKRLRAMPNSEQDDMSKLIIDSTQGWVLS